MKKSIIALLMVATLYSMAQSFRPPRRPQEVLREFCEMDAAGVRLTPEGWRKASSLFTRAQPVSLGKIIVIRDFVVSTPKLEGSKAEFYVEYIYLAQLDPFKARLSDPPKPLPPDPSKVRAEYSLLFTDKHWALEPKGEAAQEVTGAAQWRIEGRQAQPHITVDTAIRYVTALREKAVDPVIRKNATRALASLEGFKGKN